MSVTLRAFRNSALAAILAATCAAIPHAAKALDRSVAIVNNGWDTIWSVQISHIDDADWRNDLLGSYVIHPGYEMWVRPQRAQGYCRFDVLVTFESGEESILWDANLCEVREIHVNGSGYLQVRY